MALLVCNPSRGEASCYRMASCDIQQVPVMECLSLGNPVGGLLAHATTARPGAKVLLHQGASRAPVLALIAYLWT